MKPVYIYIYEFSRHNARFIRQLEEEEECKEKDIWLEDHNNCLHCDVIFNLNTYFPDLFSHRLHFLFL